MVTSPCSMHRFMQLVARCITVGVLVLLGAVAGAQETTQRLPRVDAGSIPLYPPFARIAGLEGTIVLRVTTDGMETSTVQIESGQPLLAREAEANVRTWKFEKHRATTFKVTFRYKLLPSECEMDSGTVVLSLPAEVDITAKGLMTCDPTEEVRPRRRIPTS